ncbi:hypothetical protein MKW94_024596 [Papaver nudicaule]|uniref:DNA-directed RNA polymerase I subunit rpa49 n=1 Tax=Papaver nudicaule TaxID=74823 RepID=A0AA41VD14_PAPNU|nr:hypothetical protein [Papaver nudicaule]
MRDLTNAFGTKKANKQIKVRDSLNRKEDADTVKETQKKMTELKVNPVATPSDGSQPARNIPHHDILAETPEKAYPLDRIISKQEMDILKYDLEGTLLTDGRVSPDAYPVFVCNRVQKLKEIKDEAERQTLGVILLYMTHLIKFRDQQSIDHRASAKSHRVPEILYKKFSNKFLDEDSGKKKREASGPKNDLLVSHVLVLSLMADEYKSDQTDIARDLRMTMLKLRPHYLNLGCKMVGGGKGKIAQATLPVPLKFPPLEQRRRKKKRV